MNTEYIKINGKLEKCKTFSYEEIKSIFSNNWNRTFEDPSFLTKVGLTASPTAFLVVASGSSTPSDDGKIAGICTLRTDEKDIPKGFPVNWNHWDFYLDKDNKDKIIMIPRNQKRSGHRFRTQKEWKERIRKNPPHEDKL